VADKPSEQAVGMEPVVHLNGGLSFIACVYYTRFA
jgi:hypothetical protein